MKKEENNTLILHSCKLLEAYYNNEQGITALILDAKEMRTTKALMQLGLILKELIIVEKNKNTVEIMKNKIKAKNYDNIIIFNYLMLEYLENFLNPRVNVVYFDLQTNFFSSDNSYGSDYFINQFLQKSEANEIIFASTFCLRNNIKKNFNLEEKQIILLLEKIFITNGFKEKPLIPSRKYRYKGQKSQNKSLMFVLYFLKKYDFNEKNQ